MKALSAAFALVASCLLSGCFKSNDHPKKVNGNLFENVPTKHYPPDLLSFAAQGDVKKTEAALASGAQLEMKDKNGNTALLLAARSDQIEVVRVLIEKGADTNHVNAQGHGVRYMAVLGRSVAILDLLDKRGVADVPKSELVRAAKLALDVDKREGKPQGTLRRDEAMIEYLEAKE